MATSLQAKDVEEGNLNYQKLLLFLQHNLNQKPSLTSTVAPTQLLREYLNDDDFTIYYEGDMVFKNEGYADKLNKLYSFWKKGALQQANLDDFIKCWIKEEQQLQVEYSLFDQLQNTLKQQTAQLNRLSQRSKIDTINEGQVAVCLARTKSNTQNEILSMGLLEHFYSHFCKKQVVRLSNSTFDQYQQYYNQMNLTKWMQYTRDIGLGNFQKVYPNRKLKLVFIKFQNSRKCLSFQAFKEAIMSVLAAIYQNHPQDIATEGYELLGISNIDNFNNKYRQLGLLPPTISKSKLLNKNSFIKQTSRSINRQNITNSSISIRSIQDLKISSMAPKQNNIKTSTQKQTATVRRSRNAAKIDATQIGQTSDKNEVKGNLMRSQNTLHLASIVGRLALKTKFKDQTFKEMIKEEEEDPYLRRYNNKENINAYHSLIHRIDERVEKMCNKY